MRVEWTDGPGLTDAPACGSAHKVHASLFPAEWLAAHAYPYSGVAEGAAGAAPPVADAVAPTTRATAASGAAAASIAGSSGSDSGQARSSDAWAAARLGHGHDPVAALASRVAWTAAHFGSRGDRDEDRCFPSVPYDALMGSYGTAGEAAGAGSGAGAASSVAAERREDGAPAAAVQPGATLPHAFTSPSMLPGAQRELQRHEAAAAAAVNDPSARSALARGVEAFLGGLGPVARSKYNAVAAALRSQPPPAPAADASPSSSPSAASAAAASAAAAAPLLGLHRALALLHAYGFVRVEGVPASEAATEAACRRVGALRGTLYGEGMWRTEVLPGGGNDTAYSTVALPAHVDGCYMGDPPGLQAFHCLRADPSGGHTLLVDGLAVAEGLRGAHPDTFAALAATPLQYHHTDSVHRLRAWHTPIALDPQSGAVTGIRFNNDDRAPLALPSRSVGAVVASMPALYLHIRRLLAALRTPSHELWMPLRPGTLLIFDNQRVLHGRSGFNCASGRILSGAYIGRDEWQSRFRSVDVAVRRVEG